MHKDDILTEAIEAFRHNTGIKIDLMAQPKIQKKLQFDALIEIKWQSQTFKYYVEVKNTFNRPMLGQYINRFRMLDQKPLLIARYINPNLAEDLRRENIPFIDTAGNSFINDSPLFILILGKKPDDKIQSLAVQPTFNPAGLQMIYLFIGLPDFENKPYREIAKKAKVALGTVGLAMMELQKNGFLSGHPTKKRRLIRKKELLDRWALEYPQRLRPKLLLNRFRCDNKDWWKELNITKFNACWGGDVAAHFLTKFVKPHTITIYTDQINNELVLKNKLLKDAHGNIEILKTFWDHPLNFRRKDMVHPLLIYADLMAQADSRAVETAGIIYEKEIAQLIREN